MTAPAPSGSPFTERAEPTHSAHRTGTARRTEMLGLIVASESGTSSPTGYLSSTEGTGPPGAEATRLPE